MALAVKFGREISAPSEQKIVDVFIGIGGRHLFTRYTAVDLQPATAGGAIDNYGWIFPGEGWRYKEPFLRIYFTVGFRIGWKL